MKRLFIFFVLLLINVWAFTQIYHSGSVSTETWSKTDNPHIISGDITISSGDTLTIEPGCVIQFNSSLNITISGVLKAVGNISDSITFTSINTVPVAGDWGRIYFNSPDTGCLMQYCKVLYGGGSSESCLLEISAANSGGYYNVAILNCYLSNSAGFGIKITKASLAEITDCSISDCNDYPISTNASQVSFIKGKMSISSNNPNKIKVRGKTNVTTGTWHNIGIPYYIYYEDIVILSDNILTIEPGVELRFEPGNTRRINVHGGLIANGTADSVIVFISENNPPSPGDWRGINFPESDIVSYMSYCNVGYAGAVTNDSDSTNIRLMTSEVMMTNCYIHHSAKTGIIVKGGSHITLINNKIMSNSGTGIDIVKQGGATAEFGSDATEWNEIYSNCKFELTNGLHDTEAPYVYWGTINCSKIGDSIYDNLDNNSLGLVNFNPWLDESHNVVSTTSDTWTGATDSDWGTGSNWNGGSVPCYMFDVEIPGSITNYPNITGSDSCRNLTMNPGAEISIESTAELNVFGNLVMQSNSSNNIPSIVNYGSFTVRSSSEIQDYITAGRWHYLSSPLSNDTAGVFMDMYLYSFDESIYDTNATGQTTAGWINIPDETTTLIPGAGYKVWSYAANPGSKIVSFTGGSPNDGTIDLPTTATDQDGNGSIDGKEGWNLVGNPFPSAIDWDNSGWIGKNKFDASIYFYDGTQYLSWNGSKGALTDGIIPSMQAFFVKAIDFSPLLKVGNSARVHSPSPYKSSGIRNLIKLRVTGNGFNDVTFINLNDDASIGFDSRFDAYKLKGIVEAPQLYSIAGDDILSINVIPGFSDEFTVPLGLEVGSEAEYTITASDLESFQYGIDAYLEDLQEKIIVDLSKQEEYVFTANPLDATQRFILHLFEKQDINENFYGNEISIYSNGNEVFVRNNLKKAINADVFVYNISGQVVGQKKIYLNKLEKININTTPGFYLIKVVADNKVYTQKVVLR